MHPIHFINIKKKLRMKTPFDLEDYMEDKTISKLNELIADINVNEIMAHIENDTLEDWIWSWREEAAACSFELFVRLETNRAFARK